MTKKFTPPASGAFKGIRIVDFTNVVAGPYATRWLADMGAEVIKIESSEGDYLRSQPPIRDGQSTYFGHLNSGKTSVLLDLKNPQDVEDVKKLIATADIVVENFRPGVMRKFGLDYDSLAAGHPRLIYCSISGYGQTGPRAESPAYAQTVHAESGYELANLRYQSELTRPANSVFFFGDVLGATFAFGAINAALYEREKTGRGQAIDVALMDSLMNLMPYDFQEAQFPAKVSRPVYRPLRTSDGFIIAIPNTQRNFVQMAKAMGHEEWLTDERFKDVKARYGHFNELMDTLEAWTLPRSASECIEILQANSVPCAQYRTLAEAIKDPQFEARGSFQKVTDDAGDYLVANLPFKLSASDVFVRSHVAELGESTIADLLKTKG